MFLLIQRIRQQRGAAALEALFSMVFLIGVFFTMWSVARVVNEQSRLDTATQLATRAALQTYMKNAPAGCKDDSSGATNPLCDTGQNLARAAAANVLSMNVCGPGRSLGDANPEYTEDCLQRLGLIQIAGLRFSSPAGASVKRELRIECAGTITAPEPAWQPCLSAKGEKSQAIRTRINFAYRTNWSIFTMIGGLGLSNTTFENQLRSNASAYSYGARLVQP